MEVQFSYYKSTHFSTFLELCSYHSIFLSSPQKSPVPSLVQPYSFPPPSPETPKEPLMQFLSLDSPVLGTAAAAAKSLQSCPTLCDPRDGSPPGFPVPGILQARTLEWVAILLLQCMKVKSESEVAQSCHDMLRRRFLSIFLSGFFFFFFFWMHCMNCRILVPLPAIEPEPSSVRACSSNHWTTRKFPHFHYILFSVVFVWNIFCSVSNP